MKSKQSRSSDYLDNSDKCKIIQKFLVDACYYYIAKINQNKTNLYVAKFNWTVFSFHSTGYHNDTDKANEMINMLQSHIDAEALKPILKKIPNDIGNYHMDSMKVILARSLFEILNIRISNPKEKLLYHWHDPIVNPSQVQSAVNGIIDWITGPVKKSDYLSYLSLKDVDLNSTHAVG